MSEIDGEDLLRALYSGDASDEVVASIYAELRRLAGHYLRGERPGHTLQPTALVNEAFLRLTPKSATGADRERFISIAAHLMRQVLVDHARKHRRIKRGGERERVPLTDDIASISPVDWDRWEELDHALTRLAQLDERQCRALELRYFGGLTVEETARVLQVSEKTVKRDVNMALAWLRRELSRRDTPPEA